MAAGNFIIRNVAAPAASVEIADLGITLAIGTDRDLHDFEFHEIAVSYGGGDLGAAITALDIVLLDSDGATALTTLQTQALFDKFFDVSLARTLRTITGDTGTFTVDEPNDTLSLTGAGGLTVDISGGTITLDASAVALNDPGANGIVVRTAPNTTTARSLVAPTEGITITNPDGVAGNPTFVLANDLAALEGLGSTGFAVRSAADTWVQRTIVASTTAGRQGSHVNNGTGVAGNPEIGVDINNLTSSVVNLGATNELIVYNGTNNLSYTGQQIADGVSTLLGGVATLSFVTIATPTGGPVVADTSADTLTLTQSTGIAITGTAISDTINFAPANDLAAVEALATTGLATRTGVETWATRTLTAPAAGFTITNPAGIAGDPTFVLANDLAALEGLAGTGIAVRSAADTWVQRTITGTTNRITMTNGDGVAGNPTIDIAATYVGQASITTLGTITTGVWNGTTIATGFGGTGLTTIGTANQVLGVNTGGTALEYKTVAAGTGITVTPAAGVLTITNAGVTSLAGTANQVTVSAATGSITLSTPTTFIAPGSVQVTTDLHQTQATAVTAAGATQGTATAITARYNVVTTVAAATGVILPLAVSPFGQEHYVTNRGANALNIYPNTGAAIGAGAANAAVVLAVGQEVTFVAISTTQWHVTEAILVAGTNITLTPGPGTLTIAATAGATAPGGVNTNVQFNNVGVFGGNSAFNFITGANPRVDILGTNQTNQLRVGGSTDVGTPAVYFEAGTVGATIAVPVEAFRTYLNGGSPATSAYISFAYDSNSPLLRMVDVDDDPPYISFETIGGGTYAAPAIINKFGGRGPLAGATTGFAWYVNAGQTLAHDTNFLALGTALVTSTFGGYAQASGNFAAAGDAQTRVVVLRTATTTAAVTEAFLDGTGGTARMVLPDDTTWAFRILVSARRTDANNESAVFQFVGGIDRNVGVATTAIVGAVSKTIVAEDTVAWDCTVNADTTNGSLRIQVTGEAAKTIRWVARVELVEVTG